MNRHQPLHITEISSAHWQVTIDNPPVNLIDAGLIRAFQDLLDRIDADDRLKVVVFDSADLDFFLAHVDVTEAVLPAIRTETASGRTPLVDISLRLAASPVVSIAKIRGRVRGLGSELALACDLRFASRENSVFGHPETGAGYILGNGGTDLLLNQMSRGRTLEVILGADDYDAVTAEQYGWINRALPEAALDHHVERLARRIASFDRDTLSAAKDLVNRRSLPTEEQYADAIAAGRRATQLPGTRQRLSKLLEQGLQQRTDIEFRFGERLGEL